jgi:hypothetical protein
MCINDKMHVITVTHLKTRDKSNAPNYVMIIQCLATVNNWV